jgi:hypothetical protein
VTDEELIEGLSFPVWHRVSTAIIIQAEQASSIEMVAIDPRDLQAAQDCDKAANPSVAQEHQANRGDLGYAESGSKGSFSANDHIDLGRMLELHHPDPSGRLRTWARAFVRGNRTDTWA